MNELYTIAYDELDELLERESALEHIAYLNRKTRGKPSHRRAKERMSGRRTYLIKYQPNVLVPEDEIYHALYMEV